MGHQKKSIVKTEEVKLVSRPSNEEIEDVIADHLDENSNIPSKKFIKTDSPSEGVED